MKGNKRINYLGFLSLLALIGVLGWVKGNTSLYGFFGFLYYLRYFWVKPDELFCQNLQKVTTLAFFTEMITLVFFMWICSFRFPGANVTAMSFGLSFAASIITFTVALLCTEWKESRGAIND